MTCSSKLRIRCLLCNQLITVNNGSWTKRWRSPQKSVIQIGNTRWLLSQQKQQGTPKGLLGLVVFWLTLLFAGFGLFAERNLTLVTVLVLGAIATSGAVEIILQLEQSFRVFWVSPLPMRHAIKVLSQ